MAKTSCALLKRRLDIAEIVRKQGEVKVDELSQLLNVSGVTIRQDLTYLEQQGYLKRSFGGAIYIAPEAQNYVLPRHLSQQNISQSTILKNRLVSGSTLIGCHPDDIDLVAQTLNYINDGDTLFLGHGCLIRKLIPFLHVKKSITLIINDLANAQLAKEFTSAEVIMTGGRLSDIQVVEDSKLMRFILSQYVISRFIVEATGINIENEILIEDAQHVKSYRQLIKNADHTMVILPQSNLLQSVFSQGATYDGANSIAKLRDIDITVLSRPAVTAYHQQLLDCHFKQMSSNKNGIVYQNQRDV